MRVAFDHVIFVLQRHGGVSRYFARLAEHLSACGITGRIVAPLHLNAYLDELPSAIFSGRRLAPTTVNRRIAQVLDLALAPLQIARQRPDIVHETYYWPWSNTPARARTAITVHDMIHEIFPHFFPGDPTVSRKAAAIRRADHIFCVSESTRRDLLSFYPDAVNRISVTPLGFDALVASPTTQSASQERPYILYVGQRDGHKNFAALLDAYTQSRLLRAEMDLLCVGGGPFNERELGAIERANLQGRVRQENADDRRLGCLFRDALLFAYPSLYEGFGIPPLEAMAAGCPVVTMRASSMPEVCGDAAAYADPGESASLLETLEAVAGSTHRRGALRAAGLDRVTRFSWQRCAEATAAGYRLLL